MSLTKLFPTMPENLAYNEMYRREDVSSASDLFTPEAKGYRVEQSYEEAISEIFESAGSSRKKGRKSQLEPPDLPR